jgi:hypothetical protein
MPRNTVVATLKAVGCVDMKLCHDWEMLHTWEGKNSKDVYGPLSEQGVCKIKTLKQEVTDVVAHITRRRLQSYWAHDQAKLSL